MFQGLRQSSLFYILDKGGEKPTLRIGQVISVSNPQQKYPSYVPGQTPTLETGNIPNDVYNALCEVDEAVTNLIDKVGEATKIITLSSIYKSV